mgnify:FL=1
MEIEYIVVQAGGRGSRLGHLTDNKPKALVPVNNLPILFHLFRLFPKKRFIIIGDYKADVLKRYLSSFANVNYLVVETGQEKGTCAGITSALKCVPEDTPFMLIWSDLILEQGFHFPEQTGNFVGLSKVFTCRWSYENGQFEEKPSDKQGVAGLFLFEKKDLLKEINSSGEFVKWLQSKQMKFQEFPLYGIKEYGILKEYEKIATQKCRPFNEIIVQENKIIKRGIDEQGKLLAVRERDWYKKASLLGVTQIPKIYELEPLVLERINGKNVFEYELSHEEKSKVLKRIISSLKKLHEKEKIEVDYFSLKEAYYTKTIDRLEKIRNLVPMANQEKIKINGRECRNIYFYENELEKMLEKIPTRYFCFIHGDCTFSNLLLDNEMNPVFIDPRGYFGFTQYYGDPLYDWAKLYYSIVGNYDKFNRKQFHLQFIQEEVKLSIESNEWEDMESEFFDLLKDEITRYNIKLLHAVIWLSLTTYAWEDYDSICAAFYNGLYYLEECFEKEL